METRVTNPTYTLVPSYASPSRCLSGFLLKVLRKAHALTVALSLPRLDKATALPSSVPLGELLGFSELHP